MVAAPVCQEFQDADASRPRAERLPPRCVAGIRSLHHAADGRRSVKDALFPRRRPLGDEAAEFAALVQDRERLGGSMDEGSGDERSGDEEVNRGSAGLISTTIDETSFTGRPDPGAAAWAREHFRATG